MSDASDAFGSPLTVRVDGADVEFPRLSLREYGQLERAIRQKVQDIARELLNEVADLDPKDRYEKLRDAATVAVTRGHVREALGTSEFARKALALSLKKAGKTDKEAEAVIDQLDPLELPDLAHVVVGFLRPLPEAASTTGSPSPQPSESTSPASTPAA